jgi:CxxC motif-containing protein (DUF1111 family)
VARSQTVLSVRQSGLAATAAGVAAVHHALTISESNMNKAFMTCVAILIPGCDSLESPVDAPPAIIDTSDMPIDGLSIAAVAQFRAGDELFNSTFRAADGLGPLFIRTSCGVCHSHGSRGPGLVQKMVVVEADGLTPSADQSALAYGHTLREGLAAGATTPIVAPQVANIKLSIRIGPPVFGGGYMEAVDDHAILRVAAEQAQRRDAIKGIVPYATYASLPNPDTSFSHHRTGDTVIGRFGLKARVATLDDFTADAFQGDMGLTTPMRPIEPANPDGLTDDGRPGVDLDQEHIDRIAFYLRYVAIPPRTGLTADGAAVFDRLACTGCHVPTMKTRADYPIAQLANIDAPIFSDLLLHDMGAALADGMVDGGGTSLTWRTAPLIGLRFAAEYLHDGRASTVEEAILAHGGEAAAAAASFRMLSPDDRERLLTYVGAL